MFVVESLSCLFRAYAGRGRMRAVHHACHELVHYRPNLLLRATYTRQDTRIASSLEKLSKRNVKFDNTFYNSLNCTYCAGSTEFQQYGR